MVDAAGGDGLGTVEIIKSKPHTWWSAYADVLASSGIGPTSRSVIEADARYIVEKGIFGAGEPGSAAWGECRQRSGVVMGAVQSGKTASMMAVAALALDSGVDGIVVLAGTRRSLWLQTLERFIAQIDVLPNRMSRRDLMPSPSVLDPGATIPPPAGLYVLQRPRAKASLKVKRPIIAVAMKNVAHLEQVARIMRGAIAPEVAGSDRNFHLLVIDDEADDSSIDNLLQEPGGEALTMEVKQVPRRILDLWEPRSTPGETFNDKFFATYVAYTATPQANFLQDQENPLAPRDFVIGLRGPGSAGTMTPRTSTYKVPEGLNAFYTGGDVYYRALDAVPMCVPSGDSDAELVDGVRAFLVASAIRYARQQGRLSPAAARDMEFETVEDARDALPAVATMLVNPASAMGEHFEVAGRIYAWAAGMGPGSTADFASLADRNLRSEGIAADMDDRPEEWIRWLEEYARSAAAVSAEFGVGARHVPGTTDWEVVRRSILNDIVPATTIAVINSDENADDRPEFGIAATAGGYKAPANQSTIFVSGNVMSRGLTLDGLLTTVFTRSAQNPLADTQMQMQRWFGYRGSYIDLCRIFMRAEQIELFKQFHENDEVLRSDILRAMDEGGRPPSPAILQGRNFLATGKIANVRGVSLSPGQRPFFTYVNASRDDSPNRELVAELLSEPSILVGEPAAPRGAVLERRFSLGATAELLDRLIYHGHGADREGFQASRWASVARVAGIPVGDSRMPLFRGPTVDDGYLDVQASPYAVAAYLRYWEACLNRAVPGLFTTDEPPRLWRLLDAPARAMRNVEFSVGVRFGPGPIVETGPLSQLPFAVGTMQRAVSERRLDPAWGSQNGPRGDDFFDYEARSEVPMANVDRSRPAGADGLVLFHVIERPGEEPTIAVAYSIPRGGPDFVQARRRDVD
ncbi:Z1 domain-containing protein [Demequina soli]|uniref:Z1 domain-containing protein n=1 Tax=Demequina soli TaxID=1638987 RepID=UPI0007860A06|nr:Z1 domain-containing protein [Demequina soli]